MSLAKPKAINRKERRERKEPESMRWDINRHFLLCALCVLCG